MNPYLNSLFYHYQVFSIHNNVSETIIGILLTFESWTRDFMRDFICTSIHLMVHLLIIHILRSVWDVNLEAEIWSSRLEIEPGGWDLSLKAGIWALRLKFELQGWNLSLKTAIWASRLEIEAQRGGQTVKEREKFPLRIRCPKATPQFYSSYSILHKSYVDKFVFVMNCKEISPKISNDPLKEIEWHWIELEKNCQKWSVLFSLSFWLDLRRWV